jgi:hypothetical protein
MASELAKRKTAALEASARAFEKTQTSVLNSPINGGSGTSGAKRRVIEGREYVGVETSEGVLYVPLDGGVDDGASTTKDLVNIQKLESEASVSI